MNTTTDLLIQAITAHWYLGAAMAALLLLVNTGKLPQARPLWEKLPAMARPFVPIMLGLFGGVAEAILGGTPWLTALVSALVVAAPAFLSAWPSQVVTRSFEEALSVPKNAADPIAPKTSESP